MIITPQDPDDDPVVAQAYGVYRLQSGRVLISKKLYRGIQKLEKRLATGRRWQQPYWQKFAPEEE